MHTARMGAILQKRLAVMLALFSIFRNRQKLRALCRLAVALFAVVPFSWAEEVVPFAVGEWSPYVGASLQDQGSAARAVRNICARAGITPRFDFYPWPRTEIRVQEGRAFATFPFQRIPSREGRFLFSDPLFDSPASILRSRDDPRTASFAYGGRLEEFRPFIVGTTAGTDAIIKVLRRAGVAVEDTSTIDQSLRKLALHRIQFVVEERAVLRDAIRRLYPNQEDRFVFLDRDFLEPRAYLLLVSKKYPGSEALLERFNAALRELRQEGKLKL